VRRLGINPGHLETIEVNLYQSNKKYDNGRYGHKYKTTYGLTNDLTPKTLETPTQLQKSANYIMLIKM